MPTRTMIPSRILPLKPKVGIVMFTSQNHCPTSYPFIYLTFLCKILSIVV